MSEKSGKLNRNMGLFTSICMMTGCMVGASVFIVPGELSTSNGPNAWLSYIIAAILISFSCFMFAQVGSVLPVSGANYIVCTGAVNSTWGFLYVWCYFLGYSFLFPIMSQTIATYLSVFFPALSNHITLVSILAIILTCGINALGNNLSGFFQNVCVIVLVAVVMIFSAGGVIHADWSHFNPLFPKGFMPVIVGVISTYYAFAGVNCIIEMSGEIKNPGKNIPRTVFISLAIVALMYIGMCVALVGLIPAEKLNLDAPAVVASELIFPEWFSYLVALAAIAASWTTLNAVVSAMSRVMFVMGRSNILPHILAESNRFNVPYYSVSILAVLGILMVIFSATIMQYVNISSFYTLLLAFLVAVASFKLKKVFPEEYQKAEYKLKSIWYYIWPALVAITSVIFMIIQLFSDPLMTIISIILIPVGVIFYILRKRKLESDGRNLDEQILKDMYDE